MRIINKTGYRTHKIRAIINYCEKYIGKKLEDQLVVLYAKPHDREPTPDTFRAKEGELVLVLPLNAGAIATYPIIRELYQTIWIMTRGSVVQAPPIETFEKLLLKVGYQLIDFPKQPRMRTYKTKAQLIERAIAQEKVKLHKYRIRLGLTNTYIERSTKKLNKLMKQLAEEQKKESESNG